jgi:hypothetical protein
MRRIQAVAVAVVLLVGGAGSALGPSPVLADDCVCRIEGASVSVNNLPNVQKVSVERGGSPIEVVETDATMTYSSEIDIGTSEKKTMGPFPLGSKHRARLQVTQIFPKTPAALPVLANWYVRFNSDDAYFDPCRREPGAPACENGLPPAGEKIRPLPTPFAAEKIEEVPVSGAPASIVMFEPVGVEGLLVFDNTGASPRTLRVTLILER